jgi:hypothetical protein
MGALRRGWRHIRVGSAVAALLAAACGRQSPMDDQLKKDLEAASASTMELAPNGGGQRVVSAIEQLPHNQPKPATTRRVAAPAKAPEKTQTAQSSTDPAATRPVQRPAVNPPPPGGYKTIDEVLKKAPFPIKP